MKGGRRIGSDVLGKAVFFEAMLKSVAEASISETIKLLNPVPLPGYPSLLPLWSIVTPVYKQ